MANVLPSSPPPLIQVPPETSPETSPFTLTFITGNIRVRCGCRQKYSKPALPPHNLCVRHKEWKSFGPMDNWQTRFGNITSTATYPVSRLCGQVSVRRCYTFPQVRLFSSYLPTPSSANARAIVTELFSLSDCTHTICEKEKLQFVIKCETYCGAWLPCMHQRVKLYPGLGESSKVHTVQY